MENDKKHQALLNKVISNTLKKAQKEILDNAECAIEGKDRWAAVRSRILGSTNNAMRELQKELERNWLVKYSPQMVHEDIIEVKPASKEKERNKINGPKET